MQTCGFSFWRFEGFCSSFSFSTLTCKIQKVDVGAGLSAREHSLGANACALCCTCLRDH